MQGRVTLQRLDGNTSLRDDLTYDYNDGTNRLRNTNPNDGENYTYDEIGNLISDAAEGIDSIAWTPYGKVRSVFKSDDSLVRFRYDASGNRIAKIAGSDTTVYVRDASGNVMGGYKNDTLIEQSIYGSSRLGLMTASSRSGYRTLGGKKYELSNHLGNVLAVVTDNIHLDQDSTWVNVVNMTDYYPFGLAMDGRTVQDSSYRYGFNGKERDSNGIGGGGSTYDYGFRIFNPTIGKFLSVDPLTSQYPELTPYQFASNTPIWAIDIDGLEAGYTVSYNVFVDKNGNYVTNRMHEPVLTTINGDWSGIKSDNQFFFNNEKYTSQSEIPGWSSWRKLQQEKFNKRVSSIGKIGLGVVSMVAAVPSAGGSLSAFGALGTGLAFSSASYSVASGLTDFTISFTNRPEISAQIPDGLMNATVGVVINSTIDNKEIQEVVNATLNVVEGGIQLSFDNANNLQKIDAAAGSIKLIFDIKSLSEKSQNITKQEKYED